MSHCLGELSSAWLKVWLEILWTPNTILLNQQVAALSVLSSRLSFLATGAVAAAMDWDEFRQSFSSQSRLLLGMLCTVGKFSFVFSLFPFLVGIYYILHHLLASSSTLQCLVLLRRSAKDPCFTEITL